MNNVEMLLQLSQTGIIAPNNFLYQLQETKCHLSDKSAIRSFNVSTIADITQNCIPMKVYGGDISCI